jgi:hypothetical protein
MARIAWVWQRDGNPKTGRNAWSDAYRPVALAIVGVLALHGLRALLGSAALPIGTAGAIIALVASVVPGRARGGDATQARSPITRTPAAPAEEPTPPGSPPVPALPTPALCWEWRRSYLAVVRASEPAELTRIVALRAAYLDELERRDPTGFRRWLDSGARAASDPGRYLTSG